MRPAWMSSACDSQGRMRTYKRIRLGHVELQRTDLGDHREALREGDLADERQAQLAHGAVLVVGVVEPALLLGALGRHRGTRLARQPDVVAEPVVLRRRRGVLRRAGDGPGEQRGKHRAQQEWRPCRDHVTEHTAHRAIGPRPSAFGRRALGLGTVRRRPRGWAQPTCVIMASAGGWTPGPPSAHDGTLPARRPSAAHRA